MLNRSYGQTRCKQLMYHKVVLSQIVMQVLHLQLAFLHRSARQIRGFEDVTLLPIWLQGDYWPTEHVYRHSDQTNHASTSHRYSLLHLPLQAKNKSRLDAESGAG